MLTTGQNCQQSKQLFVHFSLLDEDSGTNYHPDIYTVGSMYYIDHPLPFCIPQEKTWLVRPLKPANPRLIRALVESAANRRTSLIALDRYLQPPTSFSSHLLST